MQLLGAVFGVFDIFPMLGYAGARIYNRFTHVCYIIINVGYSMHPRPGSKERVGS